MGQPRIRCQCGAELSRPLPARCPQCQKAIVALRGRWSAWLLPLLLIGGSLSLLVAYAYWLANL